MSEQLTPEVEAEIIAVYKRTRSPFKTATETGVDVAVVWKVVDQNKDKLSSFEERHGGRGRPEIERFMVAARRCSEREWDNASPAIASARADYERGTHIMATGRDGQWLLLYSFPRRGPREPRPNYFRPEQG